MMPMALLPGAHSGCPRFSDLGTASAQRRFWQQSSRLRAPFSASQLTCSAQSSRRSSYRVQKSPVCQATASAASAPPTSPRVDGQVKTTQPRSEHPIDNKQQHYGPKILIAGAGIGGLVLAVGLLKRGFDVQVFERNITAIRGEGKYRGPIQVQSNALAALEAIDKELADKIMAQGCITGDRINGLVDGETGKWYVKFDTFHPAVERGLPVTRVISRVVLQQILAEAAKKMAGDDVIINDAEIVDYEHKVDELGKRRVWAILKSGERWEGDILVGADGINSKVRQKLVGPGAPTYSQYTCYTGIADFTPPDIDTVGYRVFLGNGRYFVSSDVGGGKMQWYGFHKEPAGGTDVDGQRKKRLLEIFGDWTDMVTDLIRATPEADVLRRDIFDRPPVFKWTKGNVILLGDSAHAMQPNLGQGGCMAIEDAYQLSKDLNKAVTKFDEPWFNIEKMLRTFQWKRILRASTIHGLAGSAAIMASTYKAYLGEGLGPLKPFLLQFKIPHPGRVGGYFAMNLTMPTVLGWVLGGNTSNLAGAREPFCRIADQPKGFNQKDFFKFLRDDDALIRASKASWLLLPATAKLQINADDEDEYMGDNFMNVCSSLDEGEACDVTAIDRFHGLRVAHPLEATKINEGITIGRDSSSGLVIDHPDVSPQHAEIIRRESGDFFLVDRGSKAGTWFKGKKVQANHHFKLHPEDTIAFGNKADECSFKVKLAHETVEEQLRAYIQKVENVQNGNGVSTTLNNSGSKELAGVN